MFNKKVYRKIIITLILILSLNSLVIASDNSSYSSYENNKEYSILNKNNIDENIDINSDKTLVNQLSSNKYTSDNSNGYLLYTANSFGPIVMDFIIYGAGDILDGEYTNINRIYEMIEEGRLFTVKATAWAWMGKGNKVKSIGEFDSYNGKIYNAKPRSMWSNLYPFEPQEKNETYTDEVFVMPSESTGLILIVRPYLPYKLNHILVEVDDGKIVNEKVLEIEERETLHLDYNTIEGLDSLKDLGYEVDLDLKKYSLSERSASKPNKEYNVYYTKEKAEEVDEEIKININYGFIQDDEFINFKDDNKEDIKEILILKEKDKINSKDIQIKDIKGYKFKRLDPEFKEDIKAEDLIDKNIYVIYDKEQVDIESKYNLKIIAKNSKTKENIGRLKFEISNEKTNTKKEYKLNEKGSLVIEDIEKGNYKLLPSKLEGYTSKDEIDILIENEDKEKIIYYTPIDKEPENPEPNPGTDTETEPEITPERPNPPYIPETIKPEENQNLPDDQIAIIEEEKLNKIDHFNYIQGYLDNTIRADNNITREEVAAVFFRLLDNNYKEKVRTNKNNFLDILDNRWSNKHISSLNKANILTGYKDNNFKPNKYITRAEVATIASRFDNLQASKHSFLDIKGHWAEKYISSASKKGWIKGYKDKTFRPDEYITRAEFVTLVNGVLNRKVDKGSLKNINIENLNKYKDLDKSKWYYYDLVEAINGHIYEEKRVKDNVEIWIELKEFNIEM